MKQLICIALLILFCCNVQAQRRDTLQRQQDASKLLSGEDMSGLMFGAPPTGKYPTVFKIYMNNREVTWLWRPDGLLRNPLNTFVQPAGTIGKWEQVTSPYLVFLSPLLRRGDTIMLDSQMLFFAGDSRWQRRANYVLANDTAGRWQAAGVYLRPGDTIGWWQPRGDYLLPSDTTGRWQAAGIYLRPADTIGRWQPLGIYLRPGDTTGRWQAAGVYIRPSDTVNRWQPKGNYLTTADSVRFVSNTGTASGLNAAAGKLGEYVESKVASGAAITLSNLGQPTNVTSIVLTAGDWDVQANVNYAATLASISAKISGISTVSATMPNDGSEVNSGVISTLLTSTDGNTIPRKRVNVSVTTTVYLVGQCSFSLGGVKAYGSITARRVR